MKINSIATDAEHEEALVEIDRLMDRNPAASTAAADRTTSRRLTPWVHRPLPRAPPRQPCEGHAAARAGPSRGLPGRPPPGIPEGVNIARR